MKTVSETCGTTLITPTFTFLSVPGEENKEKGPEKIFQIL